MGLALIGFIAFYVVVSIAVIIAAAKAAKRSGKTPWRWGGAAAVSMYLLVFWDHIPTVLLHKYYCEKEAGFWVYKTVDQWKAENPGVAETLRSVRVSPSIRAGDMKSYSDTTFLNQRFNWVVKKNGPLALNRWRHEQEVLDTETREVLARYIDFSTGYGELALGGDDWRIVKFWLHNKYCNGGEFGRGKMLQFESEIERLAEKK